MTRPADPSYPPDAASSWRERRGREVTSAFIVRVRVTIAGGGRIRRPHFTLEDVDAGRTDHFASLALVTDRLARRVDDIVSGRVADGAKP